MKYIAKITHSYYKNYVKLEQVFICSFWKRFKKNNASIYEFVELGKLIHEQPVYGVLNLEYCSFSGSITFKSNTTWQGSLDFQKYNKRLNNIGVGTVENINDRRESSSLEFKILKSNETMESFYCENNYLPNYDNIKNYDYSDNILS